MVGCSTPWHAWVCPRHAVLSVGDKAEIKTASGEREIEREREREKERKKERGGIFMGINVTEWNHKMFLSEV